jgi:hypothetical protein
MVCLFYFGGFQCLSIDWRLVVFDVFCCLLLLFFVLLLLIGFWCGIRVDWKLLLASGVAFNGFWSGVRWLLEWRLMRLLASAGF